MRLQNLANEIDVTLSELDQIKANHIIDEVQEYFRDSFSRLKTLNLNGDEIIAFEKCLCFIEYCLIHVGKSQSLLFILLDMIDSDMRLNSTRCRLNLMYCPLQVGNIRNEWRYFLKETILWVEQLCKSPKSAVLSIDMNDVFFKRALNNVFSSYRQMLIQINEIQDFNPFLFNLLFEDGIVGQDLAIRLFSLSGEDENTDTLIDIFHI